jgi:cysteinyl-tRNA synthetase
LSKLKLFNTLSKKKEIFKPLNEKQIGLYTCGITAYNYAHIGNLRTYLFEDILKRTLLYNKLKVKHVMNITDVGHLTDDEDEGQDKIEETAKKEKKSPKEISEFYANAFFDNLKDLNILTPNIKCKASDHIQDMIKLIKKIEKNGYTYKGKNGNVYFNTSKLKDYGKLAKLKLDELKSGSRTEIDPEKKHPRDFVLWFSLQGTKFKGHLQKWDSEFGEGFPGWHIECSAMSMKYLGDQFDIHCGGIDHIPVHHTNEIAQAEAATGKKWVNYWLHGEFLVLDKEKMSKSEGNFITLKTLIDKGYSPMDYRYLILNTHYRKPLSFAYPALDSAKKTYDRLKNIILELKSKNNSKKSKNNYKKEFLESVNDDLNTSKALSVLWAVLKDSKLGSKEKLELAYKFDEILGLSLKEIKEDKIPKEIKDLAEKRQKARNEKDWSTSDKLRDKINSKGYEIKDSKEGYTITKK